MIKVLQFPIRNTGSGMTQYMLNNWEYIDKSRFSFDFATCDQELDFEGELKAQGCRVHHLSCYAEADHERFCKEFNDIFNDGKYEAVHLHTGYWKSFVVEELAMGCGVPKVIVHSHNTGLGGAAVGIDRDKATAWHKQKKTEFSTELATHFCACSVDAADWLFGPQIPRERICILNNAIDVGKFSYKPEIRAEYRKKLGLDGCFAIGHVGRFEYQKNHDFLLDAFHETRKTIANAKLILIGVGELMDEVKAKADKFGLSENILFLGKRTDVDALYQAMDVFVLTSRFEGLAITLIEAQAAGLPIVTTTMAMPENAITDSIVGLPFDVSAWRNELVKIAYEGRERRDCSAAVAAAGYSLKEQIKVIERLYAGEE
jgi:glycosyltransferase involved in cell wall biosynthesis